MQVPLRELPPVAQSPARSDKRPVPKGGAQRGVGYEPQHRHAREARGDRNEGSHPRNETTEQDGLAAVPAEPSERPVQVGLPHQHVPAEPPHELAQPLLTYSTTQGVENQRAAHRSRRGGEQHREKRKTPLTDQEPGEG